LVAVSAAKATTFTAVLVEGLIKPWVFSAQLKDDFYFVRNKVVFFVYLRYIFCFFSFFEDLIC